MNLKVEYGLDGLNRVILNGSNDGIKLRMVLAKGLTNTACEQYVFELKTILQCDVNFVQIVENEND